MRNAVGNFVRSGWGDPLGQQWQCAVCGKAADQAEHERSYGTERGPFNLRQRYCSDDCKQSAKAEHQISRRQEAQEEKRSAWRCSVCGGGATEFVFGKRKTCSPDCARKLRAEQQQERRRGPELRPSPR